MISVYNYNTCIHKAFTDIQKEKSAINHIKLCQNKRKIYLGKGKETLNFFAKNWPRTKIN